MINIHRMNTNDITDEIFDILIERNYNYIIDDDTSWYDGYDDIYVLKIGKTKIKIIQNVEKINGEYTYSNYMLCFPYTDKDTIYGYDDIIKYIREYKF